ncbi:MAG: glycosyltransferase family 25 protein [Caulobacterales bacterium]|jgi:GR25 family glycosyltransferase involved in LPS biosynthesis|nr:glycosyltransferase family 25 protein [Caulobacterales bacterium]
MRLNVISLPTRADRRSQFQTWNAREGLELQFVDAAIGAKLNPADLVRHGLLAEPYDKFSAGALGNALSHYTLWKAAAQRGEPLLVCEDDACLRGDFVPRAQAFLKSLGANWDIAFLGYNTNASIATTSPEGLKTVMLFDESVKRSANYFEGFARAQLPAPTPLACFQVWGTLCYALSPRGAERLLKACFPLNGAADIVMFGQNRSIKAYTLDGMINHALQREAVAAFCAFPPLALSSNDAAGSDVVRG